MEGTKRVSSTDRTEELVVQELTAEERELLKRVLVIERAKLHVRDYEATDDLLAAVKEVLP